MNEPEAQTEAVPPEALAGVKNLRQYTARVDDVDKAKRTVLAVINTDGVDRYNTVILPKGGQFQRYRQNPVVLWCHMTTAVPLGRSLWVKPRKGKSELVAAIRFDEDEFAELVFSKYESGSMNAWSIRFDPDWKAATAPTADEIKERPDWKGACVVFRKWELVELSAVPVPGNADCLTEAVKRGIVPQGPDLAEEYREIIAAFSGGGPGARGAGAGPSDANSEGLPSLRGCLSYHEAQVMIRQRALKMIEGLGRDMASDEIDRRRGRFA